MVFSSGNCNRYFTYTYVTYKFIQLGELIMNKEQEYIETLQEIEDYIFKKIYGKTVNDDKALRNMIMFDSTSMAISLVKNTLENILEED